MTTQSEHTIKVLQGLKEFVGNNCGVMTDENGNSGHVIYPETVITELERLIKLEEK